MDRIVKQITDKMYGTDESDLLKFRVWWIPQIPLRRGQKPFYAEAPNFKTALLIDETLGRYDIYQYENRVKPDFSNVGGIQVWDATENDWVSIDKSEYAKWEDK